MPFEMNKHTQDRRLVLTTAKTCQPLNGWFRQKCPKLLLVCLGVLKITGLLCEFLSVSAGGLNVIDKIPVDHPHMILQRQGMDRGLAGDGYQIT